MARHVLMSRIVGFLVLLIAGVLSTALVAVAFMLWGGPVSISELQPRVPRAELSTWPRPVPSEWPPPNAKTVYESFGQTMVLHQAIRYADNPNVVTPGATHYQWLHQFGWPLRAFEAEVRTAPSTAHELHAMLGPVPDWLNPRSISIRHVPTRPLWIGLIVDTLVYAFLIWSFYAGIASAMRLNRIRRGLCPQCKYPINESPLCPECGCNRRVAAARST